MKGNSGVPMPALEPTPVTSSRVWGLPDVGTRGQNEFCRFTRNLYNAVYVPSLLFVHVKKHRKQEGCFLVDFIEFFVCREQPIEVRSVGSEGHID